MAKLIIAVAIALVLIAPSVVATVIRLLLFSGLVGAIWAWAISSRHHRISAEGVGSNGDVGPLSRNVFWVTTVITAVFPHTAVVTVPLGLLLLAL